jgi:hypothetical protein
VDEMEDQEDYSPEELAFMEEEVMDADIAGLMGRRYMQHPKMLEAIAQTKKPGDAALIVAQTAIETRQKLLQNGYPFASPRIWASDNGVVPELVEAYGKMASAMGKDFDPESIKKEAFRILTKYDEAGQKVKGGGQKKATKPPGGSALGD